MQKSKLTNCKTCGAEIAKSAKTCPNCGAKVKKRHPVLIGILVLFVFIATIIAVGGNDEPQKVETDTALQAGLENNSEKEQSSKDSDVHQQEETIGNVDTSEIESEEPAKEENKNVFYVGDVAKLNDITVSMVNVMESAGSTYNMPTEGNVFALCEFEIENDSDAEITISSMMSFNAYCDDYTCTYSLSALIEKGNKNQLDGTIAPGKKFNGVIGYEVPNDWKELEIHFTPDIWSGKKLHLLACMSEHSEETHVDAWYRTKYECTRHKSVI